MSRQVGKRVKYENQAIATLGDAVLKLYLTEMLFKKNLNQESITKEKEQLENNNVLKKISDFYEIYTYAYNRKHDYDNQQRHQQLPHPKHDFYLEAVIGAIYINRGIKYTKKWLKEEIYPKMQQLSQ